MQPIPHPHCSSLLLVATATKHFASRTDSLPSFFVSKTCTQSSIKGRLAPVLSRPGGQFSDSSLALLFDGCIEILLLLLHLQLHLCNKHLNIFGTVALPVSSGARKNKLKLSWQYLHVFNPSFQLPPDGLSSLNRLVPASASGGCQFFFAASAQIL